MPPKKNPTTVSVRVSNLPIGTTEEDIRALFSQYAAVGRIRLFSDKSHRRSQDFGNVDLSLDEVDRVVAALDGRVFNRSILGVSLADEGESLPGASRHRSADTEQRQDDEAPSGLLRRRYEVASVEKAAMPDGGQGDDWYRYVLSSGNARITGLHRGNLEEVTAYASSLVEDFNLRAVTGKSSRALTYAKKK